MTPAYIGSRNVDKVALIAAYLVVLADRAGCGLLPALLLRLGRLFAARLERRGQVELAVLFVLKYRVNMNYNIFRNILPLLFVFNCYWLTTL